MTLFSLAADKDGDEFQQVLDDGRADERTLALLGQKAGQLRTL